MKKQIPLLFIFLMLMSGKVISQTFTSTPQLTPGGFFDQVFDQYGNPYPLANLSLSSQRPIGGTSTVSALPTASCSSGYFNAYYAAGSYWDNNSAAQTALCQILGDISDFISSPLSAVPGNTLKINLYCDDLDATAISNGVLGTSSPFFLVPIGPSNPNQGIMYNTVQQMIISGQDPYSNIAAGIFATPSSFYHAYLYINPTPPNGGSWFFNTSSTSLGSLDYDFYSTFLHEITHALGFASMINGDGFSRAGQNNNFFSCYDQFLCDHAGTALLTSTLSSPYNMTNLAFSASTLAISQGICPGTPPGINTCTSAAKYISSNVNVMVRTPECFSAGTSLSHFEDICSAPSSFTPATGCNTVVPANSNLYFTMSSANGQGSCYVKRYLKEEERYVLCDLGYSVSSTYSSTAAGANHSYSAGTCGGIDIWGVNDGIQNGLYTYTAAPGTNTLSIPISGSSVSVLYNDAPVASTITGVQVVYNNATYTIQGTNIIVTANTGVSGLVLIKYYPLSGSSIGNATYIYAYFAPGACYPPNPCDMVQNGGFENLLCGSCGQISDGTCSYAYSVTLSCWERVNSPDLYGLACAYTWNSFSYSLNSNMYNTALGTNIVGLGSSAIPGPGAADEAVKNILSSPLIPGQAYQLSLFAYNQSGGYVNLNQEPLVITVASAPLNVANLYSVFPNGLNILTQFTLNTVNAWTALTNTFVFSPTLSVPHGAIVIGTDGNQTAILNGNIAAFYGFIDNVSLQALPTPTFSIPNAVGCGTLVINDLAQYASPIPGGFSGTGVSSSIVNGNLQYDFNSSGIPQGVFPIAFTYTAGSCVNTLYQTPSLIGSPTLTLSSSSGTICSGNSANLLAAGNYSSALWQPGGASGNVYAASPTVSTIYTVTASNVCGTIPSTIGLTVLAPTSLSLSSSGSGSVCSGSSVTLTAAGNFTSVTWQPGNSTTSVTVINPTVSTIYTATASSICGSSTETIAVNVSTVYVASPTLGLASSNTGTICPGAAVTLSASGSYTSHVWLPGGFTTDVVTVNPTVSTVYTVVANPLCSSATETIAVQTVSLNPNLNYVQLGTTLSGTYAATNYGSYQGNYILNTDATVSAVATFSYADIMIAAGATITVPSGSTLNIDGSYLHACTDEMWQGIVVEDAAMLSSYESPNINIATPVIEDAVTAIYSRNDSWQEYPGSVWLDNTTFNKNYYDIVMKDYNDPMQYLLNAGDYLKVSNCVFTCRDFSVSTLPYAPYYTYWANTNSYSGLRAETSATTGLSAPYLQSFTPATLKAPYAGQISHCGILLSSNETYSNAVAGTFLIGEASYYDYFNLFDLHEVFVNAENTHVKLRNNVFQNQRYAVIPPSINMVFSESFVPSSVGNWASAAVLHRTQYGLNTLLDMDASDPSTGNRFWDCIRAVDGRNISDFMFSNGIVRSAQTASQALLSLPYAGMVGLNLNTNSANYDIHDNEFTNISNAINIPLTAGYLAGVGVGVQNGTLTASSIYGNNLTALSVYNNTFSAGGGFMNQAVNITNNVGVLANIPSPLPSLSGTYTSINTGSVYVPQGCSVIQNQISDAWRGINVSGFTDFPVWIVQNNVALKEDAINGGQQNGIALTAINSSATAGSPLGMQTIWENTLQGDVSAVSNTLISLVYGSLNSGINSPSINCNTTSDAGVGFRFNGPNVATPSLTGIAWNGNSMENMSYGMLLDNNGIIGQQGNSSVGMGNQWLNTWTSNVNYGIYTYTSIAALSPAYTKTVLTPPNLWGNPSSQSYFPIGIPTSSLDINCAGGASIVVNPHGWDDGYLSDAQVYLLNTQFYHFLRYNDDYRTSKDALVSWYSYMGDVSHLNELATVQEELYAGDYRTARDILTDLSAVNEIESNDIAYYNLYANYLEAMNEGWAYAPDDSSALVTLAQLCPAEYGTSVFKARALLNSIYNIVMLYDDCNAERKDARFAANLQSENQNIKDWNVELFPNPATDKISIESSNENEELFIVISDLTNRKILSTTIKINGHIADLELNLINGVYLISITNTQHKSITKKLLIAR